jgi:Ca2+-binding RTX toxin-like protein
MCVWLAACGDDGGDQPSAGSGGSGGSGGSAGSAAHGGSGGTGGNKAGSGGTSAQGGTGGSGGSSSDMPAPDFEGIPTDKIMYGQAPGGCTTGSADGDTLVLTIAEANPTLLLSGKEGKLQANGVTCTTLDSPKAIRVVGGSAAETLIVDFSLGSLPQSLRTGSISVDLADSAEDLVAVAVTRGDDQVQAGNKDGKARLSFGSNLPWIESANQEELRVSTGPGNDKIVARGGGDVGDVLTFKLKAWGGAGDDSLQGGNADDELYGGSGDDRFTTADDKDGGDLYEGGEGADLLTYENRKKSLTITVDEQANDGEENESDDVRDSIETLIGGSADDSISLGANDNFITGGPGNDTLNGGDGDDIFYERIEKKGNDVMNGGPGEDTVDFAERPAQLLLTLCVSSDSTCWQGKCGCAADDGESGETDTLVNIEDAIGGKGNDIIHGSLAANVLTGNEGDDELYGEAGDDTLYAGDGDDTLYGADGEDTLDGGGGTNLFDGGGGQGDICLGGTAGPVIDCELDTTKKITSDQ